MEFGVIRKEETQILLNAFFLMFFIIGFKESDVMWINIQKLLIIKFCKK